MLPHVVSHALHSATNNPQTKKIEIIKKTASVEPPATVEPPAVEPETATGEPQTKENNKYDIMYKDFVFFSCGLYAKHRKKDGKLEKFPIFPVEWEKLEKFGKNWQKFAKID